MIDDIDATYLRSAEENLRISTFFTACRLVSRSIKGLLVRASVRKDVWASIRATDEAMDKCEQYMLDIEWSRAGTLRILANRIRHYVAERDAIELAKNSPIKFQICYNDNLENLFKVDSKKIMSSVFSEYFSWGKGNTEPHHVMHVLSAGRPRWALQLAKMSGGEAVKVGSPRIKIGFIRQIMPAYSRFRIDDLLREHGHQCGQLEDIIQSFSEADKSFSTEEILMFLEMRVARLVDVYIDGSAVKATALQIAHFLYRIGFLVAVNLDEINQHYRYEEKPHLLRSLTAPHDRFRWDVHPAYHGALS